MRGKRRFEPPVRLAIVVLSALTLGACQTPPAEEGEPGSAPPPVSAEARAEAGDLMRRLAPLLERSTAPLKATRGLRGVQVVDVPDGLHSVHMVSRGEDGHLRFGCISSVLEASRFLIPEGSDFQPMGRPRLEK